MVDSDEEDPNQINYLSFNQDNSCFAIGYTKGFKIFSSYPFKKLFEREIGSVGIVEMLNRTNLLVIVKATKKAPNLEEKLMIYDDSANKSIGTLTFKSAIRAVRVNKQLYIRY